MLGTHFYHQTLRRLVIGFGTIFNNIVIQRKDGSGNIIQSIKVPLAYSPKEKFLARLDQQADLSERQVAITLPRMGFEIAGIAYDSSRKLQRVKKFRALKAGSSERMDYNYSPVPYNISFNLYSFTSSAEGGLQIIEQILPYFQPDYTVTMIMDRSYMDTKRDIPFILESVDYEDSYTGALTERRRIIYTLKFTAKIYLYGPIGSSAIIRKSSVDSYTDTADQNPYRSERVTVTPNPTSADKDDTYTYTTTLEFFNDGKNYDEETGNDT